MNEIVTPLTIPEVIDAYNDAKKRFEFHFGEIEAEKKSCSRPASQTSALGQKTNCFTP